MLTIERVAALKKSFVFSKLESYVLADLAHAMQEVIAEPGDVLVREGTDSEWMFVLIEGAASAHSAGTLASEPALSKPALSKPVISGVSLSDLPPGAVFGELGAIEPGPAMATVTVTAPSLLLSIDHASFVEVTMRQPSLTRVILKSVVRRLRTTSKQYVGLAPST